MKIFKEVIGVINRTIGSFALGFGAVRVFTEDYKTASWILLIVSILFIIGYFIERWSN